MKHLAIALALAAGTLASGCLPNGHASAGTYELEVVAMSASVWGAIRYNTKTGESWHAVGGKWIPITDSTPLPESVYVVRMVALERDWGAVRFDANTGRSWSAKEGTWAEIAE